jgi:hypothetical protein
LSEIFQKVRPQAASFLFSGTYVLQTQNKGLNQVILDNQAVTKSDFGAGCKESTSSMFIPDNFSTFFHQKGCGEMVRRT